jgi:hypothetical protein
MHDYRAVTMTLTDLSALRQYTSIVYASGSAQRNELSFASSYNGLTMGTPLACGSADGILVSIIARDDEKQHHN